MSEAVSIVVSVIASTGIATVIMKFLVESALKEAQNKHKKEQERREERYKLDDELQHHISRVLFWIYHGIKKHEKEEQKEYWNGDLETAMNSLNETEQKIKDLDREILADWNEK